MLELLDIVKLKNTDPVAGISENDSGTIVDICKGAFTVEFFDSDGNTIEESLFKEYSEDDLVLVQKVNRR